MDNYIVSARKYRPTTFESVVGQNALTTTLKNAIATGKLAHAYLFCGPRGVGKTTCARIFAKTINCLHPTADGEACNECESCVAFTEQRSYNIHELDAASNNSVDDIRQLVDQVRIPPQIGKYKVYIIDEVHMLSASAFNAFLKTLEEPPHHALFILATTEKHKIIPTILSRCQIYDFNRIGVEDIVDHLQNVATKENVTAEPEALNVIALKADGGMRDALSIFDQVVSFTSGNITYQGTIENLNVLDYEYYFRLTDFFLDGMVSDSLLLLNDVLNHGFEGSHFITGLTSHFRDLLVSKDDATLPLLEVGAAIRERYRVQAQKCPQQFLYKAMKLCNDCDLNYRVSKNKRLLAELTLIQLAQLTSGDDDDSHGRGPEQKLKPINNQTATNGQQTVVAKDAVPAKTTKENSASKTNQQPQNQTQESIPKMPDILEKAHTGIDKKVPVMSMNDLNISIHKNPKKEQAKNEAQQSAGTAKQEAVEQNDMPVDEGSLNFEWQQFANQLPQDYNALASRMRGLRLKLTDGVSFEVFVNNEMTLDLFQKMKQNIESYLRKQLQNSKITMLLRLSAHEEKKIPTTNVEKFRAMAQKNEALYKLKEEFGLEFY